jgi:chemosensory pili system protein ChpA (sensor histidine kinase/response regulator)
MAWKPRGAPGCRQAGAGHHHLNLLHEGADIVIEMTDDGAGVPLEAVRRKAIKRGLLDPQAQLSDHEILQFILRPGSPPPKRSPRFPGAAGHGRGP